MSKKLIISEPFDYIVKSTNSNHFYVKRKYINIEYNGFKYKVHQIIEPFVYNDSIFTHVFLHNRHGVEDGCYNCYLGKFDVKNQKVVKFCTDHFIL